MRKPKFLLPHSMSYKKPMKIFFSYLNINKAGVGENINPYPRPICNAEQVNPSIKDGWGGYSRVRV